MEFVKFSKIPRLNRDCIITEKLDGTNAQVHNIVLSNPSEDQRYDFAQKGWEIFDSEFCSFAVVPGSRNKYITIQKDNYGFAKWVNENAAELIKLGPGRHFGEWWGQGIQRKYGLSEKRFSLFNVSKWADHNVRPACCYCVPILYEGPFDTAMLNAEVSCLKATGSWAAPGFMNPEGVVVFHTASGLTFKVTCENDEKHKGEI